MFIRNSAIALTLSLMAVPASGADLQEAWSGNKKTVELPTGVTLKYVEEGPQNAPPLILLHGLTDSSRSWSMTVPHLAESYHVLVLDQRGHGDSESPQCCYAIPDFAGDVVAFMDTLKIPKATIAGHSMGSFIAEYLAVDSPERVDKLILVGAAASGVGNETLDWVLESVEQFTDPIDPKFIVEWTSNPNPVDEEFLKRVKPETAKVPPHVWRGATLGLMVEDHGHLLARIKVPVLIIWGDQDSIFKSEDEETLRKGLPSAEFRVYEGIGHNVQWEQPERVAKDIAEFME
jgi:pimeloyl-ACP methyl ester carboxylesterase